MAKNDRVKEKIAESRHNDIMALRLATLSIGTLSVAIAYVMLASAYGMWIAWQAFLPFAVLIAILVFAAYNYARHSRQKRGHWIEQLDK